MVRLTQGMMMHRHSRWLVLAAGYLLVQGIGGLAWWGMLWFWPETRECFLAPGSPDAALLAFAAPDLLLFVGGSLAVAYGLWAGRAWAWPVLCVHAGAAMYAALYCLSLWRLAPQTWWGAALMGPSLVVPALIAWWFRPGRETP